MRADNQSTTEVGAHQTVSSFPENFNTNQFGDHDDS